MKERERGCSGEECRLLFRRTGFGEHKQFLSYNVASVALAAERGREKERKRETYIYIYLYIQREVVIKMLLPGS